MKGGIVVIACARCPARLAAGASREAFARQLEEKGWRMERGRTKRSVVCPDCAKKLKPEELIEPRHAGAAT